MFTPFWAATILAAGLAKTLSPDWFWVGVGVFGEEDYASFLGVDSTFAY